MQQSDKQTGSLLGYLLVAGVLTALLVGGLFWVQRYKVASDSPEIVATQDESNNSDKNDSIADSKEKTETADQKNDNKAKDKAAEPTKPAGDSSDEVNTPGSDTASQADSEAVAATDEVAELPTTGPAETAVSLLAVVALAYAAALYASSRQTQR